MHCDPEVAKSKPQRLLFNSYSDEGTVQCANGMHREISLALRGLSRVELTLTLRLTLRLRGVGVGVGVGVARARTKAAKAETNSEKKNFILVLVKFIECELVRSENKLLIAWLLGELPLRPEPETSTRANIYLDQHSVEIIPSHSRQMSS